MKLDPIRVAAIIQLMGMPGEILVKRIQKIKEDAFNDRQKFINFYPNWNVQKDARLTYFNNLIVVCDRTQFELNILAKMLDDEWYESIIENDTQNNQEYKMDLTVSFANSVRYSFAFSQFTLIESFFRIYLRSIDPTVCNSSTSPFLSIYECLLGSNQLNFSKNRKNVVLELLGLIRLIRNLIHNDGVYFDEDGHDTKKTYRGMDYDFINGKPINFATWDLLLNFASDIRPLMCEVISSPKISRLDFVPDPRYK